MTVDAEVVARDFYAAIEKAWNEADGPSFGAAFGAGTNFVDIRGVRHQGGPEEIGASHQGIFDSIYKGSSIGYHLETSRPLGDGVVVQRAGHPQRARRSLGRDQPGRQHRRRAVAFHNTLVTA